MNGYTYKRVKKVETARSKSIDFSDLSFLPKTPKPIYNSSSNPPPGPPAESKVNHDEKIPEKIIDEHATADQENENHEEGNGEIFGVILNRKCSVSSTSSHNYFISDHQKEKNASLQNAVKRVLSIKRSTSVLSIKRSSSVSEGYSRIHHQCDSTGAAVDDDDDESVNLTATLKKRSIKKKGKNIFRACRRILGF